MDTRLLIALSLIACAFILYIFIAPITSIIYFFSDDAYYYFKVALNIVAGQGSSFDTYNQTNGYHPLWMVILLPIYQLTGNDLELPLRIILSIQTLFTLGSIWLCWLYTSRIQNKLFGILALLLLTIFASPLAISLNGLESALLLFWLFFMLALDYKYAFLSEINTRNKIFVGLLFGTLFLIRLDTAFFIIALALLKILYHRKYKSIAHNTFDLAITYFSSILIFSSLTLPYFLWNYINFEHLTPISGAIKSSFPHPYIDKNFSFGAVPYIASLLLIIVWSIKQLLQKKHMFIQDIVSQQIVLTVFLVGSFLHLAWTMLFMRWAVSQWHFVAYIPLMVIFIPYLITNTFSSHSKTLVNRAALVLLTIATIGYSFLIYLDKGQHLRYVYNSAIWFKNHSKENESIAVADAGIFGYFNERATINLDGLINSYKFQDSILNGTIKELLLQQRTKYIAHTETSCDYTEKKININAYKGKLKYTPKGYSVKVSINDEYYKSAPVLYRRLSENNKSCLIIWIIPYEHNFNSNH